MKLKSYFSGTVEAAMDLARRELGEDALLVNARPATPETRYLGAYEVVFGIPPKPIRTGISAVETSAPNMRASPSTPSVGTSPYNPTPHIGTTPYVNGDPSQDRLASEVAGLKREFERMMRTMREMHSLSNPEKSEGAQAGPHCEVDPTLGRPGAARAVVALVGPPGGGKTTTLIKLAAQYGLTARRPVRILSADVYRIAAADQLRSLAAILGIGCEVAETAGALAQMLEEHRPKELVFVDTPSFALAHAEDVSDLVGLIASHPEMDTHLVLPAVMRGSDIARAIEQYVAFGPHKLIFTHIDETGCPEEMVREAARHSLPISFLGTGQEIPDDLEPADWARLEALQGRDMLTPGPVSGPLPGPVSEQRIREKVKRAAA